MNNQNNQTKNASKTLAPRQSTIVDSVLHRVGDMTNRGEIKLPKNYSAENALKSAYLILTDTVDKNKKPVLESCTKASISNALLKMVMLGLSPEKAQCAFVPYGNKLTLVREYQGTIALAKRYAGLKMAYANVIYEGDEFIYKVDPETGLRSISKHGQDFDNIDNNKIRGAYAILHFTDDSKYVEIMTMAQIRQSWQQGDARGESPAHRKFPDEMAKKTVVSRACKPFVNSSLDIDDEADKSQSYLNPDMEIQAYEGDAETLSLTNGSQGSAEPNPPEQTKEAEQAGMTDEQYDRIKDLAGELDDNSQKKVRKQAETLHTEAAAEKFIRQLEKRVSQVLDEREAKEQAQTETAAQPGF